MRLRYVLLMVVATLAASSSIGSAASVSDDVKILSAGQAYRVQEHYESKRYLRTAPHEKMTESEKEAGPVFMEHKLVKALTNPKKTRRLYQSWYKRGITAKEVSRSLTQNENRELNQTYKKLASGYAAYVKEQDVLQT